MVRVKICGIRSVAEARLAERLGADAVGVLAGRMHTSADFIEPAEADRIARSVAAEPFEDECHPGQSQENKRVVHSKKLRVVSRELRDLGRDHPSVAGFSAPPIDSRIVVSACTFFIRT